MGIAGSIGAQMDLLAERGTEPFDGDDDYSAGNALANTGHPADPTDDSDGSDGSNPGVFVNDQMMYIIAGLAGLAAVYGVMT